jgi:hypothetical protein
MHCPIQVDQVRDKAYLFSVCLVEYHDDANEASLAVPSKPFLE